jgi:hypothetical protein
MKAKRMFAGLAIAAMAVAALPTWAIGDDDAPNIFVKMCEESPDGKVTKKQVMDRVGRMFDKHDTRNEGKLDKKQVEFFLKELMREPG